MTAALAAGVTLRLAWRSMGVPTGEVEIRSRTVAPTCVRSVEDQSSASGPLVQPVGRLTRPPPASNTRPVTSVASGPISHATSGATWAGSIGSSPVSGAGIQLVRRVRAIGATAFTVTPNRAYSSAATIVNAATAALAAL